MSWLWHIALPYVCPKIGWKCWRVALGSWQLAWYLCQKSNMNLNHFHSKTLSLSWNDASHLHLCFPKCKWQGRISYRKRLITLTLKCGAKEVNVLVLFWTIVGEEGILEWQNYRIRLAIYNRTLSRKILWISRSKIRCIKCN